MSLVGDNPQVKGLFFFSFSSCHFVFSFLFNTENLYTPFVQCLASFRANAQVSSMLKFFAQHSHKISLVFRATARARCLLIFSARILHELSLVCCAACTKINKIK